MKDLIQGKGYNCEKKCNEPTLMKGIKLKIPIEEWTKDTFVKHFQYHNVRLYDNNPPVFTEEELEYAKNAFLAMSGVNT